MREERGWRGGRKRGRRKRRRVRQFLQPCLLLLLLEGEAHGYALLGEIERFGIDPERLDPSLLYRMLREMEDVGWVRSRQDEDSQGPPRKVYTITKEGEAQLAVWAEDLRRVRTEVDQLLQAYEAQRGGHGGV
jgi:PadR family transcriptional regulator PadR